jgi:uncharacterized membrane protein YgdD (TMEM256/DUF423 family)
VTDAPRPDLRPVVWGAVSGLLAVGLGAFAAHALEGRVPADRLATFQTGADYQLAHALALVLTAWVGQVGRPVQARAAARFFLLGTILFSGSLYALTLTGLGWLGAITPFGGVLFLAGWLMLAVAARRPTGAPR